MYIDAPVPEDVLRGRAVRRVDAEEGLAVGPGDLALVRTVRTVNTASMARIASKVTSSGRTSVVTPVVRLRVASSTSPVLLGSSSCR